MRLPRLILGLAALSLAACSSEPEVEFTPGSFIEKLRILGIKAGPAEITPGEQTLLESLVIDPLDGARPLSFVWLMCDPDPSGTGANVCAAQDTSRGLSGIIGTDGQLPPGVRVVPIGDAAYYRAPTSVFDNVPPDSPLREYGVEATILLVAYAGLGVDDLQNDDVEKQIAIKRVRIKPRGSKRNRNPVIEGVKLGDEPLTETALPALRAGDVVKLSAAATESSVESYDRSLPDGTVLSEDEKMVFSWYTNAGELEGINKQSARTRDGETIDFTVPAFDQTVGGSLDIYVVLRDTRGGMDWVRRRIKVVEE